MQVFGRAMAFCMIIVIGLMTAAAALPLPHCMHGIGLEACANASDCDCEPDQAPLPICCLELAGMPEMLQPHSELTPIPVAAWVAEGGCPVASVPGKRPIRCPGPSARESGPPFYLLYRVILR